MLGAVELLEAYMFARKLIARRLKSRDDYDRLCRETVKSGRDMSPLMEVMLAVCECERAKEMLSKRARHDDTLRILAYDPSAHIGCILADQRHWPTLPPEAIAALARHPNEDVLYRLVSRADMPASVLVELYHHPMSLIRLQLAKREDTPVETLRIYCDDADERVRQAARENLSSRGIVVEPATTEASAGTPKEEWYEPRRPRL